jgi:TolA-binding protein
MKTFSSSIGPALRAGVVLFLAACSCASGKLAPERWGRLTEEERHQMTRAERALEQSNNKGGLAEYELFLQLYPRSEVASYAQYMFAECTRRLGKIHTAVGEFRNVLDYFPDSADAGPAQYAIALCHTQTGDSEKALKAFEAVIEKWPKTDFGALSRNEAAAIYSKLGKTDKWLAHTEFLATADYADPQSIRPGAVRRLAAHRILENRIADAYELLEGRTPKSKAVAPLRLAEVATEALRTAKTAGGSPEKVAATVHSLAESVASFLDKKAQAEADMEVRAPQEIAIAQFLVSVGDKEQALQRLQASLKRNPENDRLRLELAETLRAKNEFGAARLVYRELKDSYRADREIAETYLDEKNSTAAIDLYKKMLNTHADRAADVQWRLGEVLQRFGKYAEAIAAYTASQKEPLALFRISECQGAQKNHDAAIQTLTSVMNFFKTHMPEAHYRIASHQAAKGDKEAAIRTLKAVCKAHLNTSWAGKAHQDLSLTYGIDVTQGGAAKQADQ